MNTNFKQSSAYELADELIKINRYWDLDEQELDDAANMLRQQADRIAELEKEADRLSNHANELRKIHADRIAELEKELGIIVKMLCNEQIPDDLMEHWNPLHSTLSCQLNKGGNSEVINTKSQDTPISLESTPPNTQQYLNDIDCLQNEIARLKANENISVPNRIKSLQDRIAELENEIKVSYGWNTALTKQLSAQERQLQDALEIGISEGFVRANQQSKPDCYGDGNVYRGVRSKDSEIQTITYTTPQTKPLSDEEIKSEWYRVQFNYSDFARAIEAKVRGHE